MKIISAAWALISTASASPAAKVGVKAGLFDAILNAGIAVQALLIVLMALSVFSWAIAVAKRKQLRAATEANELFSEDFWKATSLEAIYERIDEFSDSSLARVFKAAYLELQRIADSALATPARPNEAAPRLSGLDNLERTLRKSIDAEVASAESRLSFLATVGSTAPFVGLLGTVIGIMTSFGNIAASGSASLAVVAPGISEALFSTAVGLFAAIPAVVAYNFFIGQIKKLEHELNSFGSDFLNVTKRNFFRDQ
jgi:biopolymer transport protein TolQ